MADYSIHCLGFELSQQQAITHVLELAKNALNATWALTKNSHQADIIMLDLNTDNWDLHWADLPSDHHHQHIILFANKRPIGLEDYPFLQCKTQSLPSLRDFSHILNQLSLKLTENKNQNSKQQNIKKNKIEDSDLLSFEDDDIEESELLNHQEYPLDSAEQTETHNADFEKTTVDSSADKEELTSPIKKKNLKIFDKNSSVPTQALIASDYLFGVLHQLKKSQHFYRYLSLKNIPALLVAPLNNSFYFTGSKKQLLQYFCSTAQQLIESELTEFQLQQEIDNNPKLQSYSLATLIGYSVLANSKGRLLEGHYIDMPYPLFIEPDVNAIPDLQLYQQLTDYMLENHDDSLIEVAQQLDISLPQVIDYYNLCVMLGCTG